VEEECCTGHMQWYSTHELTLMFEHVSFTAIRVTGTYTDAVAKDTDATK